MITRGYVYRFPKPSDVPAGKVVCHNQVTRGITPHRDERAGGHVGNVEAIREFQQHMRVAKQSEVTILERTRCVRRLARFLEHTPLFAATFDHLYAWQHSYSDRAAATVDAYNRHTQAFYRWAHRYAGLTVDPSRMMIAVRVPKGRPHPTAVEDLATLFAVTSGPLRSAYTLAAFAGLRCGEIARLARRDIDFAGRTALIHGKGGKERTVPLLEPVLAELRAARTSGWIVAHAGGRPYRPNQISVLSHHHMREVGVQSTLHGLRHYYASQIATLTRDPFLVRDLLGHGSVATSEIYMGVAAGDVHHRLAGFEHLAAGTLGHRFAEVAYAEADDSGEE